MTEQEKYMKAALKLAQKAADEGRSAGRRGGCLRRQNCRTRTQPPGNKENALHHAEIEAIEKACKSWSGWRLHRCDLYVTLEPCPILRRRAYQLAHENRVLRCTRPEGRLVGLDDKPVRTAVFNHQPALVSGVLEQECADILRNFFRELRKSGKRSAN